MNIYRILLLSLLMIFAFNGCQGNNSSSSALEESNVSTPPVTIVPEANATSPNLAVVLPVSSAIITTNNQVVNIDVRVFDSANNPYSTGKINKVNDPSIVAGRDIGSFATDANGNEIVVQDLVNGVATFVYTAPSNLESNTSNLSFWFWHDSNSTDLKLFTMSIVPEVNQTVTAEYSIKSNNSSDINTNLESVKAYSYSVVDDNNINIADTDITSLRVTSLNPSLGTLRDTKGNESDSLLSSNNGFSIYLITNTKSGLIPIKVDAVFNDANGNEQNLTKIYNVVVFSGPPTAASLGYVSSSFNDANGLFTEKWRLMVTDKYSNLVNSKPSVYTNLIAGYAQSSAATSNSANYLYFNNSPGVSLSANGTKGRVTAPTGVFNNVDLVNDTIVLFGEGYNFNAFGKWDIDSVGAPNILELNDDFNSTTTDNLGFAVGHNLRNETCNGDATVVNVSAADDNITLDDDGLLSLEITFSDYMVGKSLILSTNFVGGHKNLTGQLGYAKKITLVGKGLRADSITIAKGAAIGVRRLFIYVNNSPHGRAYLNANFGYSLEITAGGAAATVVGTSMDNGITSCLSGGAAYVDVNITTVPTDDGILTLKNVRLSSEF